MRETLVLFIKEVGIVSLCAILGVAALAVTYFIPRERMRENVWASSIALHEEGLGAHIWKDIEETMLDIYTDGLMLNVSYTETKDGVRDILLGTHVEVDGKNPMESLYEVIALSNDNYIVKNYGRYWHGYQVLLRPLLCVFTYSDIRHMNMILQLALVFGFVCLLAGTKERVYVIPFLGLYIFLSPISLFSSLQYSPCFYIMMLALSVLFIGREKLTDTGRNYLFLLTGVLTAYFDFLTYPFIWYLFTKDHSCCHSYFTWRELGISVFGILMAGIIGIRESSEKIIG